MPVSRTRKKKIKRKKPTMKFKYEVPDITFHVGWDLYKRLKASGWK